MFEPKITKPEDQQALFVIKKSTIDNLDRQTIKHALFASLVALAIILSGTSAALSQQLFRQNDKGIVVLDPGHGGNDTGAQSSDGIQEKTVTLNLARMIANKLKDADLFISLHTGGSFLHSVGGTAIFYFEEHPESAMKEEQPSLNSLTNGDTGPIGWNRIQDRYLTNSKKLAEIMQSQVLKITQDPGIRVKGAPLTVLEGADMPAILVEIGYLTNPNEGKALSDQEFLSLIAEAISKGIRKFLSRGF
jgi:N-acetylmuramoyl-L-alanine amidase